MTYNALGKSIANYAAPVWSTNASDSSFKKIQTAQNAALRTATGAHKMDSIDHLHQESLTLRVKDHSDMLSAQYLVNCLEEDHVSHGIIIQEPRPKPMKKTLHSRQHSTVLPRLGSNRMESLHNLHTHAVDSAIQLQGKQQSTEEASTPNIGRGAETTEDNDALSHIYGQDTAIYCRITSIGCLLNQAISVQTVELHHKM